MECHGVLDCFTKRAKENLSNYNGEKEAYHQIKTQMVPKARTSKRIK